MDEGPKLFKEGKPIDKRAEKEVARLMMSNPKIEKSSDVGLARSLKSA